MALDYITNPTGVFFRSGKLVKKLNAYLTYATTTYPADLNEIAAGYDNANMTLQIDGLATYYRSLQNGITGQRTRLAGFVDNTFTDRVTVLEQLGVQSANMQQVLPALLQDMVNNSQAVKKCTVTLGTVTAATANVGNGTILTTKVLDGFNAPIGGGLPNIRWAGLNSELAVSSETMTMQCSGDSQSSGSPEGGEQFAWTGGPANALLDWQDEGSGIGPTIQVANAATLVQDGSFENWSGTGNNTPTNWTITNGTAGTNIFRESTNVYRGTYAMRLTGDGATATIGVNQAISIATLKPRRMYNVSMRIKTSAIPAAGTLQINFTGTGYTPGTNYPTLSEQITILAGAFPATYTLYNFFIVMPSIIPANWSLAIQAQGTLSNGVSAYIDSLAFKEVAYFGGQGAVAVAGSTRFMIGDKFVWTSSNDGAGVWQTFFRKYYKFQLNSVTAGLETISDSLAT